MALSRWARPGSSCGAVGAHQLHKGHSLGTLPRRVPGDLHVFAGLDRLRVPARLLEIQPACKLDVPRLDLPSLVLDLHQHHRVRIHEPKLGDHTVHGDRALGVVDRRERVMSTGLRGRERRATGEPARTRAAVSWLARSLLELSCRLACVVGRDLLVGRPPPDLLGDHGLAQTPRIFDRRSQHQTCRRRQIA